MMTMLKHFQDAQACSLSPGEDMAAIARQLAAVGVTAAEVKGEYDALFGRGGAVGALGCLRNRIEQIAAGVWMSVVLPWCLLTTLAAPLLPGSLIVFVGPPGGGKTFLLVQLVLHLVTIAQDWSALVLEGDRQSYLLRALAQISGCSSATVTTWIKENPREIRNLLCTHEETLREFSRHLVLAAERGIDSQEQAAIWVEQEAANGKRFLAIDPVTLLDRNRLAKPWDCDLAFVKAVKHTAEKYGATVWLTTHPVKGTSTEPRREHMAGGSGFERHADVILALQAHDPKTSTIQTSCGKTECVHNRTLRIEKSRHGPGTGARLAMQFRAEDLTFVERGIITKATKTKGGDTWQ